MDCLGLPIPICIQCGTDQNPCHLKVVGPTLGTNPPFPKSSLRHPSLHPSEHEPPHLTAHRLHRLRLRRRRMLAQRPTLRMLRFRDWEEVSEVTPPGRTPLRSEGDRGTLKLMDRGALTGCWGFRWR